MADNNEMKKRGRPCKSTLADGNLKKKRGRPRKSLAEASIHSTNGSSDTPVEIEFPNWPFEKECSLWSAVESKEIFQKLPQKPHFRPLQTVKEALREGAAIGLMATFTGVVEKTSDLELDYTKESADAILDTLLELEKHGFDVVAIRERVSHFRQMKKKREDIEKQVGKLNSEMTEQKVETSKIDKEIEEINRKLSGMQEKLSGVLAIMKDSKTREMETLEMALKGAEDSLSSIHAESEGHGSWP